MRADKSCRLERGLVGCASGGTEFMYLRLIESYAHWYELRGSSFRVAMIHAGVAFSFFALLMCLTTGILLTELAGLPTVSWVDDHRWSIWVVTSLSLLIHWFLILIIVGRQPVANGEHQRNLSPYLWAWYFLPALALFVVAVSIALARTLPP